MTYLIRQANLGDTIRTVALRAVNERGGLKNVAFQIGKNYPSIWNDFNRNQHGLGVETIVQLYHAGIVEPLQYVAEKCDCHLLPNGNQLQDDHSILEEAGHLETKSASLLNNIIKALGDGNLDDQEKKVIRRECHAAQRELWEIGQRLEGK